VVVGDAVPVPVSVPVSVPVPRVLSSVTVPSCSVGVASPVSGVVTAVWGEGASVVGSVVDVVVAGAQRSGERMLELPLEGFVDSTARMASTMMAMRRTVDDGRTRRD
jgi:hypothetical protein